MSEPSKEPAEVTLPWFIAAVAPALLLYLVWTAPEQRPLMPDTLGRFQLWMVFLCPLAGLNIALAGRARFPGAGRGLLTAAAVGYALLIGLVLLVMASPSWGPT